MTAPEPSIPKKLLIQVREYPLRKGVKSRAIVVEDGSVAKAAARVEVLYGQLQKNNEARIIFYR